MASSVPLSEANTTFFLDLLKQLSEKNEVANVFFSPFSISSALAMVLLGARGNTATQMSEVLGFLIAAEKQQPAGQEQCQQQQQQQQQLHVEVKILPNEQCQGDVHTDFGKLLRVLNKEDAPYALSVANRLYGEQSYLFVEDFLKQTKKHYSAELESVDFQNSHEAARLNINTWVETQTQGKIKDLLAKGVVKDSTSLVLVNAIYFKGNWNDQFKESDTKDVLFRLNKKDTVSVKMMHKYEKFPLNDIIEINCQVLEMHYKGKELSMLIFLPKDIEDNSTGLEKLEKELTYENFVEWTRPDMFSQFDVDVGLPRFKMEEAYDMKDVLVSMGMEDAFDVSMCDFSAMSPDNNLVLSKVVHKAFVDVNEEGTEAAAATGAVMVLTSSRPRPATFIADHPFLFFIRQNSTMSILFAGRYCSPK